MDFGAILSGEDLRVVLPFDESGGTVTIRYINREELRAIAKKATRRHFVKGKPEDQLDEAEANRLLGRAAVVGWDGHTADGEPLPYSPETCDVLMAQSPEFSSFVNQACIDYGRLVEAQREESKKNSGSTSSTA